MNRIYREPPYWPQTAPYRVQPVGFYSRPSGSGFGYLLVVLLSVTYYSLIANGLKQLTGLPFYPSLILAGFLFAMKLYFLRRQIPYGFNGGSDKVIGYLVTFIVSIILAAYGLYGLRLQIVDASDIQTKIKYLQQPEDRQPLNGQVMSRQQIEIKIQNLEEDIHRINEYPPTPARDSKIKEFESELRTLRNLLETVSQDKMKTNVIVVSGNRTSGIDDKKVNEETSVAQSEEPSSDRKKGKEYSQPIGNIRDQTVVGNNNKVPAEGSDLINFAKATFERSISAMVCWISSLILEALILILVLYLRPRNSYWE